MLIEHTLFGVRDMVQTAIDRLRQFEPPEGYYVAFSGGKDSIVVLDLIKRAGVKYDAHFNLTTVDPPELIYFVRENYKVKGRRKRYRQRLKAAKIMGWKKPRPWLENIAVHRPKETMWQLIPKKRIPPLRHMRYCCAVLKEGGGRGRLVVTGVRWEESSKRKQRKMTEQCYTDNSKRFLHPIIDWTSRDVWEYIRKRNLPYCKLYDEGFNRIGCVMCPFQGAAGMARDARRWPKIAAMYKLACNRAFEKAVADDLERSRNWRSGDEMYEWWIKCKAGIKDYPDQTVIFE